MEQKNKGFRVHAGYKEAIKKLKIETTEKGVVEAVKWFDGNIVNLIAIDNVKDAFLVSYSCLFGKVIKVFKNEGKLEEFRSTFEQILFKEACKYKEKWQQKNKN